ncbi:MAG: hydroxyacylglutathione hydrolase [Betaproteobacteria bacterium]|nr:hydroxyacylglutathione hydrolase [Betaproteobacteria bacterium]
MQLTPLPAFADNYIWLLHSQQQVLAVDPGDGQAVLDWLQQHPGLRLETILVTHHHPDHTGGLALLVQATGARVWGPAAEPLPVPHSPLSDGQHLQACGLDWQVMAVPGHTAGHLAYWAQVPEQAPVLLCGDTLFSGGCGRLFEGSPAQMLHSLQRLAALPADTRVCCAHEYTLANLRFARAAEPDNAAVVAHEALCLRLRAQGLPTLPARLGTELHINPFLRSHLPSVRAALHSQTGQLADSDAQVFAQLREWKNGFQ